MQINEQKDKIAVMQKIIDMAQTGKTNVEIVKETGEPYSRISSIRTFFLGRTRISFDIREKYKKVTREGNSYRINFSLIPMAMDFNLNPEQKYVYKAIATDNKKRTITLKIEESD